MNSDIRTLSKSTQKERWFAHALKAHRAPSYRTARWFFQDFVMRYRWRLGMIALVGFAAAGLQGAALAALNSVIRMSPDAPLTLPVLGLSIAPDQVAPAVAGFIILALAASAALGFVQGREVLRLWRRYQVHVVNALFEAVRRAVARGAVDEASMEEAPVAATLRQSQRLGAFTRLVAGSIAPALRFVVFAGIAVVLSPRLSILLFIVAIPCGWLTLLLFARGASHSARRVAAVGRDAARDLDRRLALALRQHSDLVTADDSRADSPFLEKVDAMTRRLFLVEQAKFTTATVALLVSAAFLLYGGISGALDSADWGQHFAYLLALLLAFRQLINLASSVSSFGRFYPAVALQRDVLELLEQATSPDHFRQLVKERGLKKVALSGEDDMLE